MGIAMGVMVVLMVVGFLGFGHHNGTMGGHDKESHNEVTVEDKQIKKEPCTDCPGSGRDELKNGPDSKEESNQNDNIH